MLVADAVGHALADAGVQRVFGVVGSGNFHLTNAMIAHGAQFVAARHEGGAATMADAFARMTGQVTALSVHQGCGLTNAMTGIAEAAKSRTPLLILAAEVTNPRSNFYVDQESLARAVGAVPMRVTTAEDAVGVAYAAVETALRERRTVLLNVPLEVQGLEAPAELPPPSLRPDQPAAPGESDLAALRDAIERADRPVFVAGRGARSPGARQALESLAEECGALLATSAAAKGLFRDHPWSLDVSGGFSSPTAAELIRGADLIVGWGCALNMWTMRHGRLIAPEATVVQVDDTPDALGAHREIGLGVVGDVTRTAQALTGQVRREGVGYRTDDVSARIRSSVRWRDVAFKDNGTDQRIDPRTLSIALDDLLPEERVVAVDSGNFMGYPSMYLSVPDEQGFCFTQAFQSIGLGLATGIGAALARPDRLPVAALGDGGALMSSAELETVVRLGLPMVVVIYNDDAYGAEVHHFAGQDVPLDTVRFPETDIAAIARGCRFEACTVRRTEDLAPLRHWLAGERTAPFLVDAKVTTDAPSWWLEEAFRGH
jgi:thiamine pyrophosphate-dependent acetolactate synthase large subunit-like protein